MKLRDRAKQLTGNLPVLRAATRADLEFCTAFADVIELQTFNLKEFALGIKSATVTCECTIYSNNSMTRHKDGARIFSHSHSDGPDGSGSPDTAGNFAVSRECPVWKFQQLLPDGMLKIRADKAQRHIKRLAHAGKILRQLSLGLGNHFVLTL